MKFARDFKQSLANQDFPPHWVDQAIPYSQLKKCLNKVARELRELGLDPETLHTLLDPNNDSPLALKYRLNQSEDPKIVQPKLTVYVHLRNGEIVDASLTPESRRFFQRIANDIPAARLPPSAGDTVSSPEDDADIELTDAPCVEDKLETIQVPLVFDAEFFDMLQHDVNSLNDLQAEEQKAMTDEVHQLGKEVAQVAKPSRFSKDDLAKWREIFGLYLDAEVFFSTAERNHGARSSRTALKQLQWFQSEVNERGLAKAFKLKESQHAFTRFISLNASLLKNLQFEELNKLAVYKILKKFDKRTSLGISQKFPNAVKSDRLLAGTMAKDVCAHISKDLVRAVPQLDDYLCPVCFSLAYKPVKLDCQHVFCIRCVITMQKRAETHCPLCRADVIQQATDENFDAKLEKYMRKYFSNEVREKQKSDQIENGVEDFGSSYKHSECVMM